ncbi:hypothetical protein C2845_PM10G11410 [Panicum miliaceum]|uniref:Uncharacterized protein n=1 Tax=Panicum miliaceum TaxID=4540 RepID=A0A3L6PCN7_PANMI|nr:hypothetical protein C2845_PM10G11410 [Panicum miliaceum]
MWVVPVEKIDVPFVEEVVMFTRIRAPLIGVRSWKEVSDHVKENIAESVMDLWDLENNEDLKKKILHIAQECYKGWRSSLSATYRAYDSYNVRIKYDLGEEESQSVTRKNLFSRRRIRIQQEPKPPSHVAMVTCRIQIETKCFRNKYFRRDSRGSKNENPTPQTNNNTTEVEATRSTEDNSAATPVVQSQETANQTAPATSNNTTKVEARITEDSRNIAAIPEARTQETADQLALFQELYNPG